MGEILPHTPAHMMYGSSTSSHLFADNRELTPIWLDTGFVAHDGMIRGIFINGCGGVRRHLTVLAVCTVSGGSLAPPGGSIHKTTPMTITLKLR